MNRARHRRAVPTLTSSLRATALVLIPSAAASTIRERTANAFADVARRDHATNWARSSSVNVTAGATGSGTDQPYAPSVGLTTHDTRTGCAASGASAG